jgi:cytochrome c peroxidase
MLRKILPFHAVLCMSFFAACLMVTCPAWAESHDHQLLSGLEDEPVQTLIYPADLDPKKVELGKKLFHDVRLSKNNSLSCASCHDLTKGGTLDRTATLPGVSGMEVPLNAPTIFGSSLNFAQFWDGRAITLEEQMDGPIQGEDEMASNWPVIVAKLKYIPEYVKAFQDIYQTPPTEKAIKDAIAEFERSQIPVDSPFDRYLMGNKTAISKEAQEGYLLFKNLGCASCHQGQNIGGNMFQKFGIIEDYFKDRGHVIEKDFGRFNVTKLEDDRHVFKVPSLRNIEQTAPYFHDGSVKTLDQAVEIMAKYQLGRQLTAEERSKLVAFLKSLTGKVPVKP